MVARELLSHDIIPLKTSDSGSFALELMAESAVKELPIVNDVELLGMISEEDIMDENVDEAIGSYSLSLNRSSIYPGMHIFNIMSYVEKMNLTTVPVVDSDDKYLGVITVHEILKYFATSYTFSESGSIIVLSMDRINYSLAELARIVESDDAIILGSFVHSDYNSNKILVTLKVNKENIGSLINTFERFDIELLFAYTETPYLESLKDRYDSLMNYLSV